MSLIHFQTNKLANFIKKVRGKEILFSYKLAESVVKLGDKGKMKMKESSDYEHVSFLQLSLTLRVFPIQQEPVN